MSSMMCGMLLGAGVVSKKTYVDDVFSTYLYKGTGSTQTITNNINVSEKGGMTWLKRRDNTGFHYIYDSLRTTSTTNSNSVDSSRSNSQMNTYDGLDQFTSTGFRVNTNANVNDNNGKFTSWTFRKEKGFFDVVTYTGDGNTSQQISHSLGCVPGMMLVKCTSETMSWAVYHRRTGNTRGLYLNGVGPGDTNSGFWNNTSPTSTHFTVSDADPDAFTTNKNNATYVAYLFAGGESTNTLARSVVLDGSGDYLQSGSSSDFTMGTGDFTVEGWFWKTNADDNQGLFQITTDSDGLSDHTSNSIALASKSTGLHTYAAGSNQSETGGEFKFGGQWAHVAMVRSSGVTKVYGNGTERMSFTDTYNYNGTYLAIGGYAHTGLVFNGKVSNFRVVKGTAVYTSSFKPPTEPLTSISGTVLLCCNNSSVTGTTTGSISSNGDPTASTDSPFDDPAGFVFGESGSESVIKTGSYVGNGNTDGPEVHLGWEPAFLIVKNINDNEGWVMFDQMRGMHAGGDDKALFPNQNTLEQNRSSGQYWPTPTGFKLDGSSDGKVNGDGKEYIFLAIRRSDGYVGKPPELGTGVFAMDTGGSSSTIPNYDSGFPVDFAIYKTVASSGHAWWVHSRLTEGKELQTNSTSGQSDWANGTFDSNTGWSKDGAAATVQSWMWKRHAGFDVVTYEGNAVEGRQIPHSLNKTPEMMWVKSRSDSDDWIVYHKGLNGGTNPEQYHLHLNTTAAESQSVNAWSNQAPNSTHFIIDDDDVVNEDGDNYIAMLFASTDVSKVGSYVGNDSGSNREISLGFQPRFLILMLSNSGGGYGWYVFDTKRGWASGSNNAPYLKLESSAAESDEDHMYPTSNGFMITENAFNGANQNWIYYAHA